jgi:hypothetical protein
MDYKHINLELNNGKYLKFNFNHFQYRVFEEKI